MDLLRDQLLTGARLSENQDRSVGRGYQIDLLENPQDRRARADDLRRGGQDLLLEVSVLGLELLLETPDLPKCAPVGDGGRGVVGQNS